MEMSRKLGLQELEDLITGSLVLSTGGGGLPEAGHRMIQGALSLGKTFELIGREEVQDDQIFALASHVGGGVTPEEQDIIKGLPIIHEFPLVPAATELESYLGRKFDGFFASEIGAGNTLAAMYVSAMKGKPSLDADTAGARAKPEISLSTTNVMGLAVAPLAAANMYGDVAIITKTINDDRMEVMTRYLARSSGGRVGGVRCPCSGRQAREGLAWGSISLAIKIGEIVRQTRTDILDILVKSLEGKLRFVGKVKLFEHQKKAAFNWGTIGLEGTGRFLGQQYKIWYKNENLVSWHDGKVDVTCPDSIFAVDAQNGEGLLNQPGYFPEGREVAVIARRAHEIWMKERGLALFGPGHFGFDFPYRPYKEA
jgi:uncharacterized protein